MLKRYSKLLLAMLVVVFGLGLVCAGCLPAETELVVDDDETITVYDGLGREITLDKPVERLIVAYGLAEKMVYALGAQDSLVAVSSSNLTNNFFITLKPDIADLPVLSGQGGVNVEEVISLDPDLILVPGFNKELVDNLEAKGINVFGVVAEDLDLLEETMTQLGKAFGQEEKAQQFVEYYDDTIREIQEKTANLNEEERPMVYLSGSSFLSTCSQGIYQDDLINLAGGRNAAGDIKGGKIDISPEQLIEWNPDIILAAQYTTEVNIEEIFADNRWLGIEAVINDQVFWFPSNLTPWDYPSPESILGIKWLAQKLHPEKFEDVDMVVEANHFYEIFYGKTFIELGGDLTTHRWEW